MKLPQLSTVEADAESITNPIVAIHGRMGSGKSTLAEFISRRFRFPSRHNFADPVKDAAKSIGWDGKKDERGRKLLQLLGTEVGRALVDEDVWVRQWRSRTVQALRNGSQIVLTDDMRFVNEAMAVSKWGGVLVKIVRPEAEDRARRARRRPWYLRWLGPKPEHASEVPLPDHLFHVIIDNDGDLEALDNIARAIAEQMHYVHRR